ncbi:MAG: helix-turn-helix transcriptional regulator [Pseudomonadota bacterium]|nr:helix-turn-helix transcriptional regulator [Pseudomonadota bacterium]
MNKLKAHLSSSGRTQSQLANAIGISRAYMSEIVNGSKVPSLTLAFAIERETSGAVPASSWVEDAA